VRRVNSVPREPRRMGYSVIRPKAAFSTVRHRHAAGPLGLGTRACRVHFFHALFERYVCLYTQLYVSMRVHLVPTRLTTQFPLLSVVIVTVTVSSMSSHESAVSGHWQRCGPPGRWALRLCQKPGFIWIRKNLPFCRTVTFMFDWASIRWSTVIFKSLQSLYAIDSDRSHT
jgi:hypothetical protein